MILRKRSSARRSLLRVAFIILSVVGVEAQQNQGSIRGSTVDVQGSLVLDAEVTLTLPDGTVKTTRSNDSGQFLFDGLAPGTYAVRVSKENFAGYENRDVVVTSNRSVVLNVTLGVTIEETQVTVSDTPAVSTDPAATAGAIVLKEKDIEALPDNEADLEAALRALAGPGAGPSGGEIYIDGFTGGRLPPRDSIREIRINQNPFSAEFDRLGFGRIEILTKPGTDEFSGEAEFEFEDESLNSRNPFASNRPPFQTRTFEGNFSGPLIKERASFFFDAEYERVDSNALINALVLDPSLNIVPLSRAVVVPETEIEFSPRFDIQLNENNTLVARYFFETERAENSGLGGFDLPTRAYSGRETEHTFRVTNTTVVSPSVINETRFQFVNRNGRELGEDDSPTVRVLDAFIGGGANIGNAFSKERRFEVNNTTSIVRGSHIIRFGGRLRQVNLRNSSPSNFAGTFTFTSIGQYRDTILNLPGAFPTQFSIAGGEPEAGVSRTDVGLFVLDDWTIDPRVTLSMGLRYEGQTNISSYADVSPRLSIAYAPDARGNNRSMTVFRAGFGIFYDRFSEGLTLQATRFNGVNQQQFIVTDPAILDAVVFTQDGVSGVPPIAALTALPQTTRLVSPDIRSPYTFQFAAGVERQLPFDSSLSISYIHARTRRLLRSRNINAPENGVLPNPNAGNIYQYESTGRFDQDQLVMNFRTNFVDGVSIFSNYAFGKARSDSDGAGTFPAYSYDLTGEYGDASLDIRHRFALGGNFEVPWGFSLSPFITYRSGAPFNITTGIDTNGDSLFTERPAFATDLDRACNFGTDVNPDIRACVVRTAFGDFDRMPMPGQTIIPRNYGRGPDLFVANLRISKEFGFGGKNDAATADARSGGGGGGRGGGGFNNPFGGGGGGRGGNDGDSPYNIEFSVAIRNILNRTNRGTPVGNLGSPFFGRSLSSAGGFGFGGGGGSSAGNRRIEFEIEFSF
ncbi:MAG: TonB-dependent receptor [Chloracidobacterium sp.]|nr:TonB-dependent receptor [Chloracidobacterium sp.]